MKRAADVAAPCDLAICLTESAGVHAFQSLVTAADQGESVGGWSLQKTPEPDSLKALHADGNALWVFAGRQIVTTDNLEVLCLGRDASMADRADSTEGVASRVASLGAIPVVPWGFGKWKGARGAVVRLLLGASGPRPLWLGDNSGRLAGGREPALFGEAGQAWIGVLPGSDPLPFARQQAIVGRYAAIFDGALHPDAPFETLRQLILAAGSEIACCGTREHFFGFVVNQVAMQIRKRLF